MSEQSPDKNFDYFQRAIYTAICAQYVELWEGATEDVFIRDMFCRMMRQGDSGDGWVDACIRKNSMNRKDLVVIACAYLVEAMKAKGFRLGPLAWSFLMDAQRYIGYATYAGDLRRSMPEMEAEAARDALKSSKAKGGQKTNEGGRLVEDKAIELIKAKAAQGHAWPKLRDAVRCIKPELWPFMQELDPERPESNYERLVFDRLNKRYEELGQFFTEVRPGYKTR